MRMIKATVCALAVAGVALAADPTGKWEATVETPRGEVTTVFDLTADGEKLT